MSARSAPGETIRHAGASVLRQALLDSRQDTLATFAVFEAALADRGLAVPCDPALNPPLWEPVSYTHLDVYKRQDQRRLLERGDALHMFAVHHLPQAQ